MLNRLRKFRLNRQQATIAIILLMLGYIAISTLNVIVRNYQLQQQLDELAAENRILELQNRQLELELTYYQTDAFVEKEARAKLGLQAPGEAVVIFPDLIPGPAEPPPPPEDPGFNETLLDNFREWMFFLFRIEL